ncbi:MAG TPA: FixG Ig-like domain-containing protein [Candidatus Thermoplasmatota archaeon]|nr:FixG Ig-like domain-containing protein [Candidatus Thermoplasmatota archaeon]
MSDPIGDVKVRDNVNGANVTNAPQGVYDHLDLVGAWVANETKETLEFGLAVRRWDETSPGVRWGGVSVSFDNVSYSVFYYFKSQAPFSCRADQAVFWNGAPNQPAGGKQWCLNTTVDASHGTLRVELPKKYLLDRSFAPIRPGTELKGVYAFVQQFAGAHSLVDRAPDGGGGPPFHAEIGELDQHGRIFLSTQLPIRASNGESTTMVYSAKVTNRADADDVVTLDVTDLDPDWRARVPARVKVGAGNSVDIPVILSMNFTHDHGVTKMFKLTARSTTRPGEFATLPFGVHWLEVPQPAGHHDKLWIHSLPADLQPGIPLPITRQIGWLNALAQDPNPLADDAPIAGTSSFPLAGGLGASASTDVSWAFTLKPELKIGLHLDGSAKGSFATRLRSTLPATTATLSAELFYCDPEGKTPGRATWRCGDRGTLVIVLQGQSRPTQLPANGETAFELELAPNTTAEFAHYKPGAQFGMLLRLRADVPQSASLLVVRPAVELIPKASLITMPLHEYHDPVDQAFEDIGTLRLDALDPHEKQVNPGRAAAFRFDITNQASREQRIRASVEGINSEWSTIHGDDEFTLEPNGKRQATVLVQVPEDGLPGERAELFFVAENTNDPSVVALARIRASVVSVEAADVSNEASILATEDRGKTPGWGAAFALSALALALIRRRR